MYYSKIIIALVLFVLVACGDTATSNTTATKNTAPEKKMAQTAPSKSTPAKEVVTKIEETTAAVKEGEMAKKTSSNLSKKTPVSTAEKAKATPVKKMEDKASSTSIPKKQKASKSVAKKVAAAKEKVAATKEKVVATKEKVVEAAKEVTSQPRTTPTKKSSATKIAEVASAATTAEQVVSTPQKPAPPKKKPVATKKELTHTSWDGILRKHVSSSGKVNYKGIKADKNFEAYLQLLKDNPIASSWSRNKKMAYWINAYNAYTIKLITDNYPITSITKLDGGKPWDRKWIKLGGKTYSLNDIEHKILRPQFKDARIHFAVNCAATSCPPVLNRAWTASNLNSNLEKQTKLFINNPAFNSISGNQVKVSKIFDWYKEDFGDLISYINKYSATKVEGGANVDFKEYDWALNE